MNKFNQDRRSTSLFSEVSNVLTYSQSTIREFLNAPFSISAFAQQIEEKSSGYSQHQRDLLATTIEGQYQDLKINDCVARNIELLAKNNTFTVTTGHQLCVYGGPLYFLYKIVHVIQLAEKLNATFPKNNFVPVFWLASEDHDFDEIASLKLFGKSYTWETNQNGAVGRMKLDDGFFNFKKELLTLFSNDPVQYEFVNSFYTDSDASLAQATRRFVNTLFEDYGLLIVDGDDAGLKASFGSILKQEIETSFSSEAVEKTTEKLVQKGFKPQVNPREINLFMLDVEQRTRIESTEAGYKVGDTTYTKEALFDVLEAHPERFSPNVVLRPLYQEFILPNLCYVGGGGEMAYWLQLKRVFEKALIPYPLVSVRNSIQFVDRTTRKKMKKLELDSTSLFQDIEVLKKDFVIKNSGEELNFSKSSVLVQELADEIQRLVNSVDQGMSSYAKAEVVRLNNQIDGFQQKLIRQQKKKFEDQITSLENIFEKMFPDGHLQERKESSLAFLTKYGASNFLSTVFEAIDPENNDLIVLLEDEN